MVESFCIHPLVDKVCIMQRCFSYGALSLLMSFAFVTTVQAAPPVQEIIVAGERVFPESITSAADGSIIISSIGGKGIFRAQPGAATAELWVPTGTNGSHAVLGVLADDMSQTLWACFMKYDPAAGVPPAESALLAFDLKTGATKGAYPLPRSNGACNDIAIAPDGTAYATDSINMEVVRLKKGAQALETWAAGEGFGKKNDVIDGLAVIGNRVLVNAIESGKLFNVPITADGAAGPITEVKLDRGLARPDGMRSFGSDLLVAEAGAEGKLSRIKLNGNSGTVTTVKAGFPGGPVAVTVVGSTAYVLEGQLKAFSGKADGATLTPFRATAVDVGKP